MNPQFWRYKNIIHKLLLSTREISENFIYKEHKIGQVRISAEICCLLICALLSICVKCLKVFFFKDAGSLLLPGDESLKDRAFWTISTAFNKTMTKSVTRKLQNLYHSVLDFATWIFRMFSKKLQQGGASGAAVPKLWPTGPWICFRRNRILPLLLNMYQDACF